MLIWVNGMFGVGKTQVAHELQRRLPGSIISDPEQLGFGIQRMYPRPLRDDFQRSRWWAPVSLEILSDLCSRHPGTVIVPMTLTDEADHGRIIGGLRDAGHYVCHVTLLAGRAVVLRRLRSRFEHSGWALEQFDARSALLATPTFATHIDTDRKSIAEVADAVAEEAGLTLSPADPNQIRGAWRRRLVQLRHVRFD